MIIIGTNTHVTDAHAEDRWLAELIESETGIETRARDVRDLAAARPAAGHILLRNCWPDLAGAADQVWRVGCAAGISISPPPPRRNPTGSYGENKRYLVDLHAAGLAVPPTALGGPTTPRDIAPSTVGWIAKPIAGCSSVGIVMVPPSEPNHPALLDSTMVIQPRHTLAGEVSYYFVDGVFSHGMVAADPHRRWDLKPWSPSPDTRAWAEEFTRWARQPYGICRIDAGYTDTGELFLIEIEDTFCYLSLEEMAAPIRTAFVRAIAQSILRTPSAGSER